MPQSIGARLSFGSSAAGSITQLISNIQSTFGSTFKRRNAVIYKILNVCGHRFATILLTKPTCCSQCNSLIWGLYGFSCKSCELVSHKKCLNTIKSKCIKNPSRDTIDDAQTIPLSHKFVKKCFLPTEPTMCNHCGTLICSLIEIHQGLQCLDCNMSVHYKCEKLVCSECHRNKNEDNNNNNNNNYNNQTNILHINKSFDHKSKLKIEDFEIIRLLGTGSFSKVYLAKLQNSHEEFAIKVIKKTNLVVGSDPDSVFTEMRTLNLGRKYPFLAIAHCCFQSKDRLYLVMEHVIGRDLVYYIRKTRKFTEDRARFYAAEIVLALIFLHSEGVVYRDLKLDNVILDKHGHCKLIDFGMSKELYKTTMKRTRTFCGTPSYISPEIIRELDYDFSVDWWSLGVLIYEMLAGCSPFEAQNEDEIYRLIVNEQVKYPSHLSCEARSLLEGLLTKEPQNRLGCQIMGDYHMAIREHPFFLFKASDGSKAHQWDAIEAKRIKPPYRPTEDDLDLYEVDEGTHFTPISPGQLEGILQDDFEGFSFYSESFSSLAL